MTEYRFISRGLKFVIEGHGFASSEARNDFDLIADKIETALDAMPTAELARLHAIAVEAIEGGSGTYGTEATALDDIVIGIKVEVTRGWYNPNGCDVSLIALPT